MTTDVKTVCVAGKNDIACLFLEWALDLPQSAQEFVVLCNRDDSGKHSWQRSLRFTAKALGVREISLNDAYSLPDLLFISLEYDRIVKPERFRSNRLFNIHFSALPKYRGVATSVWPLLNGEAQSGVTLHCIDPGIDTGDMVAQTTFDIDTSWNARWLYYKYMETGLSLIQREYTNLLQTSIRAVAQRTLGATYFGRNSIDFQSLGLNFRQTAWQVHNQLRAFTFHEYQYPHHPSAGYILRSCVSTQRSQDIAGKFTRRTRWSGHISTLDYDVDVQLSPHLDLYAWCRGESSEPEEFEEAVRMVDLNQVDRHGWTPLMVACFHGNINACRILIEHGADANATGLRGTTPLMYAKESFLKSGRSDVFELLLAHGADPNQRDVLGLSVDAYIHQERRAIPLLQFLS